MKRRQRSRQSGIRRGSRDKESAALCLLDPRGQINPSAFLTNLAIGAITVPVFLLVANHGLNPQTITKQLLCKYEAAAANMSGFDNPERGQRAPRGKGRRHRRGEEDGEGQVLILEGDDTMTRSGRSGRSGRSDRSGMSGMSGMSDTNDMNDMNDQSAVAAQQKALA
eukprot:g20489.t1